MIRNRMGKFFLAMTLTAGLLVPALRVSAAEGDAASPTAATADAPSSTNAASEASITITSDADTAAELKLLLGDGRGVNAEYLAKTSTRLQAALISLRLQGVLQEALEYASAGKSSFSDASLVNPANQNVLAYLKNHPGLGWEGLPDGSFDPLAEISSQQFYKVLLEVLGFRTGTDFDYGDTEAFAASKGLTQIRGTDALMNAHIATALVESLSAESAEDTTLFEQLKDKEVIAADAQLPDGERITLRTDAKLGTYFADQNGMALYFYTKDSADLESCQGKCIENWPLYYADSLQIPSQLHADDFSAYTRKDGTKQLTYKGWPLYYFVKDTAAGDVAGEAVGGVWFLAKSDYAVMIGTSTALGGNYLTDDYGRTLYYFDKDMKGMSMCEGNCLVNWPAYSTSGASTPTGVASSDIGSITRNDGTKQSTYKGYPLYYFLKDAAHGDAAGQGLNKVWYVIDPAQFTGTTVDAQMREEEGSSSSSSEAPSTPPPASGTATAKTYHVDIKQFSFGSEPLKVEAGSKIVFTNYDDMNHNAVANDGSFATKLLAKGESVTITLDKPGTYEYFCEPHKEFMTGTIIVE